MQLTQHTDYALRLMIVLARGDGAVSLPAFAADQGLSYNHIAKVAQALVHAGFVDSRRGRNGGVVLAQEAAGITIGAVVRAMEPGLRLANCGQCALRGDCGLSSVLARALEAFLAVLDATSLAAIAARHEPAFVPWTLPVLPEGCASSSS